MTEFVACPETACDAPAEVLDRYTLNAAGSPPVTHVATHCVAGHRVTHTTD